MKQSATLSVIFLFVFLPKTNGQSNCPTEIGMNLYFNCYWSHELPFANLMVQAGTPWLTSNETWVNGGVNAWNTEAIDDIPTDAAGYPLQLPAILPGLEAPQIVKTPLAFDNEGAHPVGEYVLQWEGAGDIELFGPDVKSLINASDHRKVYFVDPTAGPSDELLLKINYSQQGNHVHNVRVWLPGCEHLSNDFNPAFLEKLKPFKAIRTFNWQGVNDSKEEKWENRSKPNYFSQGWLQRVAPWEYAIRLCNVLQKDLWLSLPHSADSAYIRSLAQLMRDSLDPQLKIILEYSNEVWNPGFAQYAWVDQHAPSFLQGHDKKYAWFTKRLHDIFSSEFEGQTTRLVRVISGQQYDPSVMQDALSGLQGIGGSVDAITTTGYFGLTNYSQQILNGLGNDITMQDIANRLRIDIQQVWKPATLAHATIANNIGAKLYFYESGSFVSAVPNSTAAAKSALVAFQEDTLMGAIYDEWLDFLRDEVQADLIMPLTLADDNAAEYGSFGHLNNVFEQPPYPIKYQTLLDNLCTSISTQTPFAQPDNVAAYPNPTTGKICFLAKNQQAIEKIQVFDTFGTLLTLNTGNGSDYRELDFSVLPSGVYWCRVIILGEPNGLLKIVRSPDK